MQTELQVLLVVQADDVVIHGLEERLVALEPRIRELDIKKERVSEAIERTSAAVETEEKKQAYIRDKIVGHRELIDRNEAAMDLVKTLKQATAAAIQIEQAKLIVSSEESDLLAVNRRLDECRAALANQTTELASLEAAQLAARAEVAVEKAEIDVEIVDARSKRAASAKDVPAALLSRYDRIRGRKRVEAVYAMRGMSCGNCDTSIPMQRRHLMAQSETIDLCEGCGVLMYYVPG
ncbi:MAG: hypothetical protein CK531_02165 [Gemmatimonadetes bacterium]|nr:MAG: hypothetical protein CK531_02165 [Gemmatimonadota bacterium]